MKLKDKECLKELNKLLHRGCITSKTKKGTVLPFNTYIINTELCGNGTWGSVDFLVREGKKFLILSGKSYTAYNPEFV